MCRVEEETVSHIVSECEILVKKEYKKRHDNVCMFIHWRLCKKHSFEAAPEGYEHEPDGVKTRGTRGKRFCGILQSRVIPRLKLDDQMLLLLIKSRRRLRS